jgi:hypothetical protein
LFDAPLYKDPASVRCGRRRRQPRWAIAPYSIDGHWSG